MKDTESYVNKAELKRKVRAWLRYRESAKQTVDELISLIEKLPVTVKGQLETTLDSNWISVKGRLPNEYGDVLVFRVYNRRTMMNVDTYDTDRKRFSKYHNCGITHWMPLPQKPESE